VLARRGALAAAAALWVASTAAAQQTVVLTNGDRLTGQLVAIADGQWTFKHAGGELKIAAAEVAAFTAQTPVGLRLGDGTILAVTVSPAGDRLQLVGADGATRLIAPADLAAVGDANRLETLRPVRIGYFSPFTRFWGTAIALGFTNTTGNSKARGLAADLQLHRSTAKDRIQLGIGTARNYATPYADSALVQTVSKIYGNARVDVFLGKRLFAFGATTQDHDKFQNLDLRSAYHGGLGYQILALTTTDFRLSLSGGYRREDFVAPDSVSGTPILAAGTALKQRLGPIDLQWNFDWAPSTEDLQDYRILSTSSATTTIVAGLGFQIASRNEFNNNPPAGFKKHDWLLTTALTYSLGR
jgi:putative salt-induced outer membrane protein YdiY